MTSDELLIKTYAKCRKLANQLTYWGHLQDNLFERDQLLRLGTDFSNIAKDIIHNLEVTSKKPASRTEECTEDWVDTFKAKTIEVKDVPIRGK